MEQLSYEVDLDDEVWITCPLCHSGMAGLEHAGSSGCPHIVALTNCYGDLKTLQVEDYGAAEDISELIREKAQFRWLLEGKEDRGVTQEDLVEAWGRLGQIYSQSVLVEFRINIRFQGYDGSSFCHGLFVMDDCMEQQHFLENFEVRTRTPYEVIQDMSFGRKILLLVPTLLKLAVMKVMPRFAVKVRS